MICWALVLAFPVLLPALLWNLAQHGLNATPGAWAGVLYLGLISNFLAFFAWYRGLHIGGVKGGSGAPWFVIGKDVPNNQLIVHQGEHEALYSSRLRASAPHWISTEPVVFPLRCMAKTRYRQADQACVVTPWGQGLEVVFDAPQRAVTPGQFVVFLVP